MIESGRRTLLAGSLGLSAFLWLVWLISNGASDPFDQVVRQLVQRWASPWGRELMQGISLLGSEAFLAPVAIFFVAQLKNTRRQREALLLVIVALGVELLSQILKLVFHRPRPDPFFGIAPPSSYSFPSGHALISMVFYGTLGILLSRRASIRLALYGLAALIGFSRIYLGVHYPTDVLAGFAMAVFCLSLVFYANDRNRNDPYRSIPV